MKDVRPALRSFLLSDTAIAALVATRIFPIKIPQGVVGSAIVYTRISEVGDYTMSGPSGLAGPRIQIDAWADSADGAARLANLIKDRIDGYRGVMGSGGGAITVHGVFVADMREDYDDTAELYRSGRDYFINHLEL